MSEDNALLFTVLVVGTALTSEADNVISDDNALLLIFRVVGTALTSLADNVISDDNALLLTFLVVGTAPTSAAVYDPEEFEREAYPALHPTEEDALRTLFATARGH